MRTANFVSCSQVTPICCAPHQVANLYNCHRGGSGWGELGDRPPRPLSDFSFDIIILRVNR